MKTIKHQTNDDFQVIEPNLHDSNLFSVENDQGQAILKFRLVSGELVQAIFTNVKRLVCNDFREGNIVLDVTIEREVHVSDHGLEKLFIPPMAMFEKYNAYIQTVKESIESGKMMLVTINPSYGCDGMIYCENVCFQQI
ncbi:hypothetical protein [Reinekea sp. G2M2-21]|uniref:hypothetical protein n=1 Tax=Reinekea sp. G2M2-21 TaxID=2788942 RepID=UPI0018AC4C7E|nr:hypothetical protein [Reinekea sp. G2M2-21]